MPRKVVHRLRTERRHAALTQADLAALLGVRWKTRVTRYERGAVPPIAAALAYEVIFDKPMSKLLGTLRDEVAFNVRRRARELLARNDDADTPRRLRRKQSIERIAA